MVNINMVMIAGNIGKDPVLRRTESGRAVLNFSLANDRVRKVGGVTERRTSWFDITVWDEQAEHNARHLTSGSEVIVTGRLNVRTYNDREGNTRRQVEIIASNIHWVKLAERKNRAQETMQLTTQPETVRI